MLARLSFWVYDIESVTVQQGYAFTAPRSGGVMERLNSKWRRRCYEKSNY